MDLPPKFDLKGLTKIYPQFSLDDIERARDWLRKQPHLPSITDEQIFIFFRRAKFSLEMFKERVEKYYSYRTHLRTYFDDRSVKCEKMKMYYDTHAVIILPEKTEQNHLVVLSKILDAANFNFQSFLKMSQMLGDLIFLKNYDPSTEGIVSVMDLGDVKFSHIAQANFNATKHLLTYGLEAYPMKTVEIHFLNPPAVMSEILNILKQALKKDSFKLIYLHETIESLAKFVPLELLPNDYAGGKLKSIKELHDEQRNILLEYDDLLDRYDKHCRVNENLRQEKNNSFIDELNGMNGSFKKLDID